MSRNPSQISTALAVDPALVQDADYELDADDRQYIDNQIRGCQEHLVAGLIRGVIATWVRLSGSSAAGAAGDVVCLTGSASVSEPTVTRALAAAMANAGGIYGVLLRAASPGAMALVALGGSLLPPTLTGLTASANRFVYLNTATARLARIGALTGTEYVVGTADVAGWCALAVQAATPGAGGYTAPTGTGIPHIVAGVQQAASSLIVDGDVHAAAAIALSKLAPLVATEDIALTGTQHDLALATPSTVPITIVRFTDAGGCTMSSLAGGVAGRLVILVNAGGALATTTFEDEATAGGTAANRLIGFAANPLQIQDTGVALIVYDGTSSRWRQVARAW